MQACVLLVSILALGGLCLAGEESNIEPQTGDESCSHYCSATYPEHTYPEPDDHCACTRGCRLAIMDALISWPFAPERSFCLSSCQEAYGSNGHLYACQTGCNVTTIDQKVPNRDQSYQTTGTNELGFVLELFEAVSSQLQTGGSQMDDLTQQAETMYQLLPGGAKVSTIVIIQENEGPVEIEYGENFVDAAGYPAGGRLESVSEEEGGEETATYRLSCPWNYTAAGRLLSVVGVGLILIAIIACCCSGLLSLEMEGTQEEEEEGIKKREMAVQMREKVLVAPRLKSPLTFSPGYPQPLPYYCEKSSLL